MGLDNEIIAYETLLDEQGGLYPPCVVMARLRLSASGLQAARVRGKLRFTKLAGTYYYGKKSVSDYRWTISRKFKDSGVVRSLSGKVLPWPRPRL